MECKKAACVSATGECVYTLLDDGTACSIGTCKGGECVEPEAPAVTPPAAAPPEEPVDNTVLFIVILAIIIAGYFLFVKKKPKAPSLAGKK